MKTQTEDLGINHPGPLTAAEIPAWVRRQVIGHQRRDTSPELIEEHYWAGLEHSIVTRYLERTPEGTEQLYVIAEAESAIKMYRDGSLSDQKITQSGLHGQLREDNTLANLVENPEVPTTQLERYQGLDQIKAYSAIATHLSEAQAEFLRTHEFGKDDSLEVIHNDDNTRTLTIGSHPVSFTVTP